MRVSKGGIALVETSGADDGTGRRRRSYQSQPDLEWGGAVAHKIVGRLTNETTDVLGFCSRR